MSESETVVIIGAGQAGNACAQALRRGGFTGAITLLGEEPHPPYERPPLSKAMLVEAEPKAPTLATAEMLAESGIVFHPSTTVVAIDRAARRVVAADGGSFPYDRLVLATGTRPRVPQSLPEDPRIRTLRVLEDAAALKAAARPGLQVLSLGGGVIGLEIASSLSKLGCRVTVVEAAPRLLSRNVAAPVAEEILALHARHGVEILLGVMVQGFEPGPEGIAIALTDGSSLTVGLVVIGIGVLPNQHLAAEAGLPCRDGILVDAQMRTEDPRILAIGDVAAILRPDGSHRRIETWANASRSAEIAAAAILGRAVEDRSAIWFWTDQHGVGFQFAGETAQAEHHIRKQGRTESAATWYHLVGESVVGATTIDNARDMAPIRRLLEVPGFLRAEHLAGAEVDLRGLLQQVKARG